MEFPKEFQLWEFSFLCIVYPAKPVSYSLRQTWMLCIIKDANILRKKYKMNKKITFCTLRKQSKRKKGMIFCPR